MLDLALYAATALIWGSTWLFVTLHLGVVPPEVSLAYRYWIAALLLLLWCRLRGLPLGYNLFDHFRFARLGLVLFCANFLLLYFAQTRLSSGVVATVFATLTVMNMLNSALMERRPIEARMAGAAVLGIGGIALTFVEQLASFELAELAALGLALAGTYSASLGNVMSAQAQARGLPVIESCAFGMAYGALYTTLFCLARGADFTFEPNLRYAGSLLYLAVFGSILGFGCFLTLIGRVGAARAGYVSVLFPIVALTLSTLFEDYRWTWNAVAGTALVLLGNLIVLAPRRRLAPPEGQS